MKLFQVLVEDRVSRDIVCVGAMLTLSEARELVSVLNRFNSTDILIYTKEEFING